MDQLISINEAVAQGIERLRRPIWANPMDHLKIDLFKGSIGPWIHLWCPFNTECNGHDPINTLIIHFDLGAKEFVPYTGPLPDSAEYKAEVARYAGCLA